MNVMNLKKYPYKPLIGIAVCGFDQQRQFVSASYVKAIEASGGIPILLPCVKDLSFCKTYASLCSGFLFCGGGDVTPYLFGEEPFASEKASGVTDLSTDLFHLSLAKEILALSKPFLGICRGMQILNLALGGSIFQDLSLVPKPVLSHMQDTLSRSDPSHNVHFKKDSILYNFFSESYRTNSFHHQAINHLGEGLSETAHSEDGITEAVEMTEKPFTIGVQWHPECMYESCPKTQKLFQTFIRISKLMIADSDESRPNI